MGKTLYLHIGSPKTGTTSIQHALEEFKDCYISQGIKPLLSPMLNNDGFAKALSQGNIKQVDRFIRERLEKDITNYVLSSENLFWLGENYSLQTVVVDYEKSIAILKRVLDRYFSKVVILLYLRPQAELINSMYIQDVQFMNYLSLDEFKNRFNFDYFSLVHFWEYQFGKENIVIHSFPDIVAKGSLLDSFNNSINVKIQIGKDFRSNPTLTSQLFYFKRDFNKIFETTKFEANGIIYRIYGYLDILLEKELALGKEQHIELSDTQCEEIDIEFLKSNNALFSRYNLETGSGFNSNKIKNKLSNFVSESYNDFIFLQFFSELIVIAGIEHHQKLFRKINKYLKVERLTPREKQKICKSFFLSEYKRLEMEKRNNLKIGCENRKESFFSRVVRWIRN